jgi:hypothetical protein
MKGRPPAKAGSLTNASSLFAGEVYASGGAYRAGLLPQVRLLIRDLPAASVREDDTYLCLDL